MSESSERSPLLNLAVALFDEKIISLMQLERTTILLHLDAL